MRRYALDHRQRGDGSDAPSRPPRRDRRPYIEYGPDPDQPDGAPRTGMPLQHDHEITYSADPRPDERALDGALYGDGVLPLFAGVRDERGGTPRRTDDLPTDLDATVDGLDLGIDHLPDLDPGGR